MKFDSFNNIGTIEISKEKKKILINQNTISPSLSLSRG